MSEKSKPLYDENFEPDADLLEEFKKYEKKADVPLAIEILFRWSQFDGSHHKEYAIDQILRALVGSEKAYKKFVKEYENDGDYEWGVGIAP